MKSIISLSNKEIKKAPISVLIQLIRVAQNELYTGFFKNPGKFQKIRKKREFIAQILYENTRCPNYKVLK